MSSSSTPPVKVPPRFVPTLTEVVQVSSEPVSDSAPSSSASDGSDVFVESYVNLPALERDTETKPESKSEPTSALPATVATPSSLSPTAWSSLKVPSAIDAPVIDAKPIEKIAPPAQAKQPSAASIAATQAAKSTSLTMSEMLAKLDALPTKKDAATDKPNTLFAAPAFRFDSSPPPAPPQEAAKPPLGGDASTATPFSLSANASSPPPQLPTGTFFSLEKPSLPPSLPTADISSDTPADASPRLDLPSLPETASIDSADSTDSTDSDSSGDTPTPISDTNMAPNVPPVTFKQWGAAAATPTQKVQRPVLPPPSFPIVDVAKVATPAAVKPTRASPPIPEGLEEYLVHRVMQRVDLALEKQLQDAVERVIKDQTQSLVTHLREEVESVVRQSVYEAVAQELVVASEITSTD